MKQTNHPVKTAAFLKVKQKLQLFGQRKVILNKYTYSTTFQVYFSLDNNRCANCKLIFITYVITSQQTHWIFVKYKLLGSGNQLFSKETTSKFRISLNSE